MVCLMTILIHRVWDLKALTTMTTMLQALKKSIAMNKSKSANPRERSRNSLAAWIVGQDRVVQSRRGQAQVVKRNPVLRERRVLVVQPGQTTVNAVDQRARQAGKPVRQLERDHPLVVSPNPQEGQIRVDQAKGPLERDRDSANPRWGAPKQAGLCRLALEAVQKEALEERKRRVPAVDLSQHLRVSEVVAKAGRLAIVNTPRRAL